jgi:thiol-disulfide isomerase/thioredoxin
LSLLTCLPPDPDRPEVNIEDLAMPQHRPALSLALLLALSVTLTSAPQCQGGELRTLEPKATPPLDLPDLAGAPRSLAAWRGQVVLVNFWATWCRPCVEEIPGIQRLAEQMRDRPFAVIGVNVAETQRRAAHSVEQMRLAFPVLLDADGMAFRAWGGKALPTSVVIDRQGTLRYLGLGPLEWDGTEAVKAIEGLLEERERAAEGPAGGG